MIYYVIPARAGSKGFPRKNRILFSYTWDTFDDEMARACIISTDDMEIIPSNFVGIVHNRSAETAGDTASMKSVMKEIIIDLCLKPDDIIILCYLTYPQRTRADIKNVVSFFSNQNLFSLLCCMTPQTHPCLCVYTSGRPVIAHELYRRQDYPQVYEISHFLCAFKVSELSALNENLYGENTFFYPVSRHVDVDAESDLLGLPIC